jgi:uncharacterized protein (DUF1778 family)
MKIRVIDAMAPKWHLSDMAQTIDKPRGRITTRVSGPVLETIEQAAELLGSTVNQFIAQTAYEKAREVIERETVIRLSQQQSKQLFELLNNPPRPNKYLKEAVKQFKKRYRED